MSRTTVAELRRQALGMIVAMRTESGGNLDRATRRYRVQSIHDSLTSLLAAAQRAPIGSAERAEADRAVSDVLWAVSASAERFGWQWERPDASADANAVARRARN